MYVKLFQRILDSSVWLEDATTRLVWITLLAAMDQDGFARFAAIGNLANRARVTTDEAASAVAKLEAPDRDSSNPDNEGRRIERVQGGWMILNAKAHHEIARREQEREATRLRVAQFRASKKAGNGDVTPSSVPVTTLDIDIHASANTHEEDTFQSFWVVYPRKKAKKEAAKAWSRLTAQEQTAATANVVARAASDPDWLKDGGKFIPYAATYLNGRRWEDEGVVAAGAPEDESKALARRILNGESA